MNMSGVTVLPKLVIGVTSPSESGHAPYFRGRTAAACTTSHNQPVCWHGAVPEKCPWSPSHREPHCLHQKTDCHPQTDRHRKCLFSSPTPALAGWQWCLQVFSIIIFGCITSEGWRYDGHQEVCIVNNSYTACQLSAAVGILAFIIALGRIIQSKKSNYTQNNFSNSDRRIFLRGDGEWSH